MLLISNSALLPFFRHRRRSQGYTFEPLVRQKLCKIKKTVHQLYCFNGADDGARTRYLHLGKVALYQMSYIRILLVPPGGIEPPTRGFSVPCSTD